MEFRLHHIGIAVKELEPVLEMFRKKFGFSFDGIETVESQKVRVSFTDASPAIELVQATQETSARFPMLPHPVKSFIKEKGEGLHHLCFCVDNIDSAFSKFKEGGVAILGNEILTGSKGKKIFFIDPRETAGILIEIKEENELK